MKRRLGALLRVICVAVLGCSVIAACSAPENDEETSAGLTQITFMGQTNTLNNIVEQVAADRGFFKEEGMQLSFLTAASGSAIATAVLSGSAQLGTLAPSAEAAIISKGDCLKSLTAGISNQVNIIAQPELKLAHAGEGYPAEILDLKGHTIGIAAVGAPAQAWVIRLLQDAGLSAEDVTFIGTGVPATAVPAFQNRQVDFQLSYPPIEQLLGASQFQMVANLVEQKGDPLDDVLVSTSGTTCSYAEEHPKTISGFCSAVKRAYSYLLDPANDSYVVSFIGKTLELPVADAKSLWQAYKPVFEGGPIIQPERWNAQEQFLGADVALPDYASTVIQNCVPA